MLMLSYLTRQLINRATNIELCSAMMSAGCMKRDGRTLDWKALETIRLMAVERVREGESASEVIAGYGFNRTTI